MMRLSEINQALGGKMVGEDVEVHAVGTDSRQITPSELFVAIAGERFDGNQYALAALKQGAAAALVSVETPEINPAVIVKNTRDSLGVLAQYWRNKFNLPLIAVTGSNGKTTVKEMIASILKAAGGDVLATKGNLNNDIGMPLTLLKLRQHHTHAVIEMGMNHEGEIRYLSQLAQPQVALINNAGIAHIGELGSREAIARAKGEIFAGLRADGIAVINADDNFADYWRTLHPQKTILSFGLKHQADVSARYSLQQNGLMLSANTPNGAIDVRLSVLGEHNAMNALAAITAAIALDIPNAHIAAGLSTFRGVAGRLDKRPALHGATVIDDTYNANPDSMQAALDVLASERITSTTRLIFVMGDMAELGPEAADAHARMGHYAKLKGVDQMFTIGSLSQLASASFGSNGQHYEALESLLDALKNALHPHTIVLVKGSRASKMERVVNLIVEAKNAEEMH